MMPSLLLTGGAGFIGSCFVRQWLAEEPRPIVVLDKLTYAGNRDSLAGLEDDAKFRFVHGDIGDRSLVSQLLVEHDIDAVINLAAETHVDRSIDDPECFVQTNVVGAHRLLEASFAYWQSLDENRRRRFRFLHVSTDEVYGTLGSQGRFTEQTPYAPNSPYSASKAAADHFVRAYYRTYDFPTLTTNCSNNYGPRQYPEKLVPLIILNAMEGRPLPVYGDGRQVRDWLYVEDHCHALRTVLRSGAPGQVYNIGGDCERTNLELVQTICEAVDRLVPALPHRPCRSLIRHVADRPGHDRRYAIDATKIRNALRWRPISDLAAGIERTVRWYVEQLDWVAQVRADQVHRERLGKRGVDK